MYQQVTGFTVEQVVGQNLSYHFVNEANEEDSWQRIKADIHTGKVRAKYGLLVNTVAKQSKR